MFDVVAFRVVEELSVEEQAHLVSAAFRGADAGALPQLTARDLARLLHLRLPQLVEIAEDVPGAEGAEIRMAWVDDLGDVGLMLAVAPFGVGIARPLEQDVTPAAERAVERICEVLVRDAKMVVFDAGAETTWEAEASEA